jgi:hypothetical protein
MRRGVMQPDMTRRAKYFSGLLVSSTLLGALALQMKEISKGRDPREMDNGAFWGAALMQGGGLGIFGDFLASETNRFGGGFAETVAGPVVGLGADMLELTAGNAAQVARGEDPRLGRDLVDFAKHNTPGGSIWYARLVLERAVYDQLARLADPDFDRRQRALQRRMARETGQQFFWRPGRLSPDRAPDIGTALGDLGDDL